MQGMDLSACVSLEGTLPRRGVVGMRCTRAQGVVVEAVVMGDPAALAGIAPGDRIVALDGVAVDAPDALTRMVAGCPRVLTVATKGTQREVTVIPREKPLEAYPGAETVYSEVTDGARLRTIAVRPKGAGPHPCVVYLQGYDCVSIDRGNSPEDPLVGLVRALVSAGIGFFRTEKEGVGDSTGNAPEDVSFAVEQSHARAGLRAARDLSWVDARAVVVLGHSLGGLHAPVIATGASVLGVMVYGAGAQRWSEYLAANLRRQLTLAGADPAHVDAVVRAQELLSTELLVQGASLSDVLARHPELLHHKPLGIVSPTRLSGRHPTYWQAVQRASWLTPLHALDAPLLAAWGASDWLSFRDDHQKLADVVEKQHPGRGRFTVVPSADHWFIEHPTPQASYAARGRGSYNPAVGETLLRWMDTLGR